MPSLSRAQRLQELEPNHQLKFLDKQWDRYIFGIARRARDLPLPVYGFNAIKAGLEQSGRLPGDCFRIIGELLRNKVYPSPLFLRSFQPLKLRDEIAEKKIRVWDDHLSLALLGLCMQRGEAPVAAYSYWKTVEALMQTQMESAHNDPKVAAIEFLENRLMPVWLGQDTPYFIQPID